MSDVDIEKIYKEIIDFNGFYIHFLSQMNKSFTGNKMNVTQMRSLIYIHANGRCTPKQISERFSIDLAYLCRNIRELESKGYVKCIPNDADGRSHLLMLTAAGEQAYEQQSKRVCEYVQSCVVHLSDKQVSELVGHMDAIKQLLGESGHNG